MAETFSPVRPNGRRGIVSFISAINTCGLALLNTAAAVADFRKERLLTWASVWFFRSHLPGSATIVRINVHARFARSVIRLVTVSIAVRLNVVVSRKVVVDGRKIFIAISL